MLNKFKYRTPELLLQKVAAHTCPHARTHSNLSLSNVPSTVFSFQSVLLLKVIQKGIDYKGGLTPHSPQKGCKNKHPSVTMWIQPPYHFIKMTANAFLFLWSQSGRCVWLSRAFGGESTSLMCFNKHDLDCSLVLFWSMEMSLLFNSLCWSHSCWQHLGPPNKVSTVTGTGHVRQNTPFLISFVTK